MHRRASCAFLVVAAVLLGCDDQRANACLCTTDFVTIYASVFSRSRVGYVAVTNVQVLLTSSQEILAVTQDGLDRGSIRVIDDGFLSKLQNGNDQLSVSGTADSGSFEARITVAPDGPCRCHVQRIAGPTFIFAP